MGLPFRHRYMCALQKSTNVQLLPKSRLSPTVAVSTLWCSQPSAALQAPVMLALGEALTAVLVYVLLTRRTLPLQRGIRHFRYSFNHSLEDVLVLSLLRSVAVLMSLPLGPGSCCHRWVSGPAPAEVHMSQNSLPAWGLCSLQLPTVLCSV